MRTAVVSDLHFGARSRGDLLRRSGIRSRLMAEIAGYDEVVLLGDIFELRQAPGDAAFDAAEPFFADLGEVLGSGRVVLVPGNHDHGLAKAALQELRQRAGGKSLECLTAVGDTDPLARFQATLGRTELVVSYPGFWIRRDVYATHGHYLDLHSAIPNVESLFAAASAKLLAGGLSSTRLSPQDYERALAPVYALADRASQAAAPAQTLIGSSHSARLLHAVWSSGAPGMPVARQVFSGALSTVNRLGLGPFDAVITSEQLTRAGLSAMAQVVARLQIEAAHVLFGHTHRAGPRGVEPEFALESGTRLVNTGAWVREPMLIQDSGPESVFWPGVVTTVKGTGAPRQLRVLDDLSSEDLEGNRTS